MSDAAYRCEGLLRVDAALRKRLSEIRAACAPGRYHQTIVIAQLEALYQCVAREAGKRGAVLT